MTVEIRKLFGRFDYKLETKNDGFTILTGPNGYGKSTILRIIQGLSKGLKVVESISKIDFELILIKDTDYEYSFTKKNNKIFLNGVDVTVLYSDKDDYLRYIRTKQYDINNIPLDDIEYYDEFISDSRDNYYIELDNHGRRKIIKKYSETFAILDQKLKSDFSNLYFIKEQRLIKPKKRDRHAISVNENFEVIDDLPKEITQRILRNSNNYSEVSTKLDSTYPMRLFENKEDISEEEFLINSKRIKEQYSKLSKYSLASDSTIGDIKYEKEYSKALKVYFDDFNQKYSVYEPLIESLDMFTDIINSRLSFKHVEINKEKGLIVIDDKGVKIDLKQLSSGEKQEIVLFYELIFEVNSNALLLIDEPEISLHIAWQKMFAEDLLKIASKKNLSVIVATHSPYIINNRWDNQIDLGSINNELDS